MKLISIMLMFFVCFIFSCKKKTECPNLQGVWLLTEIWRNDLKTIIADTSTISETLKIEDNNSFISSSTKTAKVWNSGTFDCDKIFDVNAVSFKKGSKYYFNLYEKR